MTDEKGLESVQNGMAKCEISNVQSPTIFKLDLDCFDELFEYLSLEDLSSIAKTCKRMQIVSGDYFRRNYSAAKIQLTNDGIYTLYAIVNNLIRVYLPEFNRIITNIFCKNLFIKNIKPYELDSINEIYLKRDYSFRRDDNHYEEYIVGIKTILSKIEILHVEHIDVSDKLADCTLPYCENLKRLRLHWSEEPNYECTSFLRQKFPKLEHFDLNFVPSEEDINGFFRINPNIRSFSTEWGKMWQNKEIFLKSDIQLDTLKIVSIRFTDQQIDEVSDFLNQLYKRGFFKGLHLVVGFLGSDDVRYRFNFNVNHLISINALEKLSIWFLEKDNNLHLLTNLRELYINCSNLYNENEMKIVAKSLINLQILSIDSAKICDVPPFICYSPKLRKFKVIAKTDFPDIWYVMLDLKLQTLNNKRKKLADAQKLIIYISDHIFLATKWATNNGDTNFSLIEMRRADSYKCDDFRII